MKFLLFNVAVIAALIFLFGMDRRHPDTASRDLPGSAEGLADLTHDAVEKAAEFLQPKSVLHRASLSDEPTDAATAPEQAKPPRSSPADIVPDPFEVAEAPPARPAMDAEANNSALPGNENAFSGDAGQVTPDMLPVLRDPAVAKRRAEVLEGIASTDAAPALALADGERLMSPEQRVRELHALAEEMELLFVDKMAP